MFWAGGRQTGNLALRVESQTLKGSRSRPPFYPLNPRALCTLRWVGANNDPDIFEYVFSSGKIPPDGANRGHYRNPRLDALLDRGRVESDREKRRQTFSEVEKIVADDVPYLNLWYLDNVCAHRRRVAHVELAPIGDYGFLDGIIVR